MAHMRATTLIENELEKYDQSRDIDGYLETKWSKRASGYYDLCLASELNYSPEEFDDLCDGNAVRLDYGSDYGKRRDSNIVWQHPALHGLVPQNNMWTQRLPQEPVVQPERRQPHRGNPEDPRPDREARAAIIESIIGKYTLQDRPDHYSIFDKNTDTDWLIDLTDDFTVEDMTDYMERLVNECTQNEPQVLRHTDVEQLSHNYWIVAPQSPQEQAQEVRNHTEANIRKRDSLEALIGQIIRPPGSGVQPLFGTDVKAEDLATVTELFSGEEIVGFGEFLNEQKARFETPGTSSQPLFTWTTLQVFAQQFIYKRNARDKK
jgi:hypothetical protein